MTLPPSSDTLPEELVKLLVQVAWADHELAQEEVTTIRHLARALDTSPAFRRDLEDWLRGQQKLPPPDLALLRQDRDRVMRLCTQVVIADAAIRVDENELLHDLHALLADPT